MDFLGSMSELSEASEAKRSDGKEISKASLDKFDALLGDDKIHEIYPEDDEHESDSIESEPSEVSEAEDADGEKISKASLDKFDALMGDDKIHEIYPEDDEHGLDSIESELSEASEVEDADGEKISNASLDKFDTLLGDDKIHEETDTEGNQELTSSDANIEDGDKPENTDEETERKGLTEEEKQKIRDETGWSNEIIDAIGSMEEAEIYIEAGLKECEINGKKCLIRGDIDWNQKDEMGRTNKERAEQGLPPITKDGKRVELHHIGQHANSPLAELTTEEHRGKGNDTVLHDKTKESEINRPIFAGERSDHWKARAQEGGNA